MHDSFAGVVIHHVATTGLLSRPPHCLRLIDTCISELCRNIEQAAAIGSRCGEDGKYHITLTTIVHIGVECFIYLLNAQYNTG